MENILETKKPTRREFVYFRQRQKNKVFQSVIAYFAQQAEEQGLTKKKLAQLLDRDPAQISRWLSGPGNWTLDTVSDLLLVMNAEMEHQVKSISDNTAGKESDSVITSAKFDEPSLTESSAHDFYSATPVKING